MSEIQRAPTKEMIQAFSLIDAAIGVFLGARRSLPPLGKWESFDLAMNFSILIIRHCEAVCELGRLDMVLLPSAIVLARAAFETAINVRWLLMPDDVWERELRWLRFLRGEQDLAFRYSTRVPSQEAKNPSIEKAAQFAQFIEAVSDKLPTKGLKVEKPPKFDRMLAEVDLPDAYPLYMVTSQYVHGSHFATGLYAKNLGANKVFGEFLDAGDWANCLDLIWFCLSSSGEVLFSRIFGKQSDPFSEKIHSEIQRAISSIRSGSA